MATTRPITTFFQPVKSSETENETVHGIEAEAMEFENGEGCFMLLFHFRPIKNSWIRPCKHDTTKTRYQFLK